ncbi:MAG: PASTA domain-containing protein [Prevotellamassilia sp.]
MSINEFFKKIFSPLLMGNCLGIVLASVVLLIGALFFLDSYTRHGDSVEIPDVRGLDEQTAKSKLEAVGLLAEVTDTGYVYRATPYSVLEQSLLPGEKVKPGRTLYLTINADGPRKIALPDVADNCSRREAEDKLKVLGFKLGATEYIVGDPEWVYGIKVNGRDVSAGTRVSVNTPVVLVVGAGGLEEEYNGNDSLDYLLNVPIEEEEIIEGETTDAPETSGTTPSAVSSSATSTQI